MMKNSVCIYKRVGHFDVCDHTENSQCTSCIVFNQYQNKLEKHVSQYPEKPKLTLHEKMIATLQSFPREFRFTDQDYNRRNYASAIMCLDGNNALGYKNQLVVKSKFDMKLFQEFTIGKVVVMGRKTFESMNKQPLPYRINVVVTRDNSYDAGEYSDYVLVVHSLDDVFNTQYFATLLFNKFKFSPKFIDNTVIIGGKQLYVQAFENGHINHLVYNQSTYCAQKADTYIDIYKLINMYDCTVKSNRSVYNLPESIGEKYGIVTNIIIFKKYDHITCDISIKAHDNMEE